MKCACPAYFVRCVFFFIILLFLLWPCVPLQLFHYVQLHLIQYTLVKCICILISHRVCDMFLLFFFSFHSFVSILFFCIVNEIYTLLSHQFLSLRFTIVCEMSRLQCEFVSWRFFFTFWIHFVLVPRFCDVSFIQFLEICLVRAWRA